MSKVYPEEKWFLLYMGILYILSAAGCFFPEGTLLNIWIFYYYRTVLFFLPIISGMLFGYTLKKNRGISFKRILIWGVLAFLVYSVLCWLPLFSLHDIFLPTVFWRFRWCITEGPALLLAISFLLTALLTGRKEKLSSSKAPFPFLRALLPFGIYGIIQTILFSVCPVWSHSLDFSDPWIFLYTFFIYFPSEVLFPVIAAIRISKRVKIQYSPNYIESFIVSSIHFLYILFIATIPWIIEIVSGIQRILNGYIEFSMADFSLLPALLPSSIFFGIFYFLVIPVDKKQAGKEA